MKRSVLQNIKNVAKKDFISVEMDLRKDQDKINASVDDIRFSIAGDKVTATCDFRDGDSLEVIEASIVYTDSENRIYADSKIKDVSMAIKGAMTTITAADEDEDFVFDDESFDDEMLDDESADMFVPDEIPLEDDLEEYENPESDPNIENDNNIAGHYIAECDRCHGIFISALMESDQEVEFISGICPLCEKESDQYIKWVIKSVEN